MSFAPIRAAATLLMVATYPLFLSTANAQTPASPPIIEAQPIDPHNPAAMRGGAKMGAMNMSGGVAQPQTAPSAAQSDTAHNPPPMVGGAKMGGMNMSRPVSHADMHHHRKSHKTPKTPAPA